MSNIARLYAAVHAAVPNCEYVRVSHWQLRTTWEAVPLDGAFTRAEQDKIAQIFASFVLDDEEHGDVGAAGRRHPLITGIGAPRSDNVMPSFRQRMVEMERSQKDLERRVLTLELRLSVLLEQKEEKRALAGAIPEAR